MPASLFYCSKDFRVKLPNYPKAVIPESKITDYLLSTTHPSGRGKAIFFMHFGFSIEKWYELANALLVHAAEHDISGIEPSPFGMRCIIEGKLHTPVGRKPMIRAIWFIDHGTDIPRFVTAYPGDVSNEDDTGT